MKISFNECNLNTDFFHFTNVKNVPSIMENGLIPSIGTASQMVDDRANVSISQGAKGILGIINSFIYEFQNIRICEIPEVYRPYFSDISNFEIESIVTKESASTAMKNKLKDEVYLRVEVDEKQLSDAKIGGLTGFDVNLSSTIDKSRISIVTDEFGNILSAYDVVLSIYDKIKDVDVFREFNADLFYMIESSSNNFTCDGNFKSHK